MWRTALRNLAAHKRRLFTTGLAVMLGVAFMTGTLSKWETKVFAAYSQRAQASGVYHATSVGLQLTYRFGKP